MVSKTEASGRNSRPDTVATVATVATRTISEFTSLRQEMRAADRVPAGVELALARRGAELRPLRR